MPTTMFALAVAFSVLLGTPLLAPVIASALRRPEASVQRGAFGLMAGWIACVVTAWLCDLSTTSYEANAVLAGGSVVSAGVLGISAFRLKHRPWNVALGVVASMALGACLLVGTVGALAVMFVVGDTVPVYVADLPDRLRCEVISFGNATTSADGYDVKVGRRLSLVPFFELPVSHRRFDSQPLTPRMACDAMISQMHRSR